MSQLLDNISDAFETLKEIGNVSSTKSKQEILEQHTTNSVLKTLLFSAYNPFVQYNIKKIPTGIEDCGSEIVQEITYSNFLELLVKLSKRDITGNAAVQELSDFLTSCSSSEYLWYSRVIEKDLDIGLADKGINKVFKNLIPSYEVMLASKIDAVDLNLDTPKVLKMLPKHIIVQYKIDGYRLNIHVPKKGDVLICTRNGKVVEGYNDLEKEAAEKLPKGFVYDGEIVSPELFEWIAKNVESEGDTVANRDLFSEVMSHAFSHEEDKQGIFNLFDMVPIDQWNSRKSTETLETRTAHIENMVKPLILKHINIVPTSRVYDKDNQNDLDEVVKKFHQFVSVGWEGLMIKDWDGIYEFKRTKGMLKMKLMDNIDLTVVDVYEGTGKYSGMLGGVYVEYKGNQVGVGSGWSDEQRQYYWQDKNRILGKTIEIAYQAETKNKKGELSLSFPVVKKVRDDK